MSAGWEMPPDGEIFGQRQVLLAIADGEEGWDTLAAACLHEGEDLLHTALTAIALELIRTSATTEQLLAAIEAGR